MTLAGLDSGPIRLKTVRKPSSARAGPTCFIAEWCAGANMKPMPASRMQRAIASGVEVDLDAERGQRVGGAGLRRQRAVAVLGDGNAGAGDDEGRGGRDVVAAGGIAAGADDVDGVGRRLDPGHLLAHGGDRAGDLVDGLAAHPQRRQERADLHRRRLARHDDAEGLLGLARG